MNCTFGNATKIVKIIQLRKYNFMVASLNGLKSRGF